MTQRSIVEYPDPRLHMPSVAVEDFDESVDALIEDLFDTLYAHGAIALSAPQVDDRRQVLVMDHSGNGSDPKLYINPQILKKSAWGLVEESCLSVPGVVGNVIRATEVRVRARDRNGELFERDLSGMEAVCLQHEMDHFAGKLFIQRQSIFQKISRRVLSAVRSRTGNKQAA